MSPKAMPARKFVSESEVEALTGISKRTLQKARLFGKGGFPFYRVGRRVLYDISEVEELIRGGRVEAISVKQSA